MKALLAFEGVSLVRAGVRLLDRIDLSIAPGDRLAVVGESGSGKGWLLRLALGLVDPGSGVVRLMGVALDSADTDQRRLLRARCGVAMQGGSLLGELTVCCATNRMRARVASLSDVPERHSHCLT